MLWEYERGAAGIEGGGGGAVCCAGCGRAGECECECETGRVPGCERGVGGPLDVAWRGSCRRWRRPCFARCGGGRCNEIDVWESIFDVV